MKDIEVVDLPRLSPSLARFIEELDVMFAEQRRQLVERFGEDAAQEIERRSEEVAQMLARKIFYGTIDPPRA